jgi:hypothetical protein
LYWKSARARSKNGHTGSSERGIEHVIGGEGAVDIVVELLVGRHHPTQHVVSLVPTHEVQVSGGQHGEGHAAIGHRQCLGAPCLPTLLCSWPIDAPRRAPGGTFSGHRCPSPAASWSAWLGRDVRSGVSAPSGAATTRGGFLRQAVPAAYRLRPASRSYGWAGMERKTGG